MMSLRALPGIVATPGAQPEKMGDLKGSSQIDCHRGSSVQPGCTSAKAADAYADLTSVIVRMRDEGLSLRQIAKRIDAEGHTTRRGKIWNSVQVWRVLGN
jgi:hypothetical protein